MSLFDAFCKSPEVLANQHAGHLELLAFGVDIALALYEIICINVSWKACSTFSALVNQLDVSVIQATFGRRPKFQTLPWERLLLTWRVEALIKTPRTTVNQVLFLDKFCRQALVLPSWRIAACLSLRFAASLYLLLVLERCLADSKQFLFLNKFLL